MINMSGPNLISHVATPVRLSAPPAPSGPVENRHIEDAINIAAEAGVTGGVAAATSALAPAAAGGHALAVLGFGVAAAVAGCLAGTYVAEKASEIAARAGHVSHSPDEMIIYPVVGAVTGTVAAAGAALATGFAGASPLITAAVAGGAVLGLYGLASLKH